MILNLKITAVSSEVESDIVLKRHNATILHN